MSSLLHLLVWFKGLGGGLKLVNGAAKAIAVSIKALAKWIR